MGEEFSWLRNAVVTMGHKTIEAVEYSITAMLTNDTEKAEHARKIEKLIDSMYYTINEYCLNKLADHTYTRMNINYLVNSLKIAMELERICDYANQIAKIEQKKLAKQDTAILDSLKSSVANMQEQTLQMLKMALRCYENLDETHIQAILDMDSTVDKKNREIFREMICLSSVNPWSQEVVMDYYTAVRYIQRVGDRATNIAELAYYIITGLPIRQGEIWYDGG
jgi:phosphate transport system protein